MDRRFWSKVERSGDHWLWMAGKTSKGYGFLRRHGRPWLAHRYAWTLLRGPIPEGLDLDHVCRVHACVRPREDHLEPVTRLENIRRGLTGKVNNHQTRKTSCPLGHAYSGTNLIIRRGRRECRTCRRERRHASTR